MFFIGDEVSGLIDFYFACTDALAYDLAICLNAWCFEPDGSFNLTKGQAMIARLRGVRPLDAPEVEALPILCRGAALRFMLTRLVDWLNVPPGALVKPKDPLEYDRKLSFHRRVTNAREYGLDDGSPPDDEAARMERRERVTIYTDGACSGNPGPGGWGAILIFRVRARRNCPAARRSRPITAWS